MFLISNEYNFGVIGKPLISYLFKTILEYIFLVVRPLKGTDFNIMMIM